MRKSEAVLNALSFAQRAEQGDFSWETFSCENVQFAGGERIALRIRDEVLMAEFDAAFGKAFVLVVRGGDGRCHIWDSAFATGEYKRGKWVLQEVAM